MKNILILVMPFLFCPSATAAEVVFKTVKGTFVLNIDEEKAPSRRKILFNMSRTDSLTG